MLCNRPNEIPEDLETLHEIYENLSAQLNGETDAYRVDPGAFLLPDEDGQDAADEEEHDPEEELRKSISFLVQRYSPRLDPDITEKICDAYPAWCRANGRVPTDANDPLEIGIAAFFFAAAFVLLALPARKKRSRK